MADTIAAQPYIRGTKTVRIKTARLVPGDRVLTVDVDHGGHPLLTNRVRDSQQKTGAVVRAVASLEAHRTPARGFHGRAGRVYTVYFTDGTRAGGNAPILTWHALVVDKESSASRQHFIDTGAYLTEAEVAEFADAAIGNGPSLPAGYVGPTA